MKNGEAKHKLSSLVVAKEYEQMLSTKRIAKIDGQFIRLIPNYWLL